ncbi:MAG TPA: hypothetical protein PKM82_13720 [Acidovorax sp.]|nr:hypothetical protein [Acidovorax sp.]
MLLVKTQAGQDLFKERRGGWTLRQRAAFILFDGKRVAAEVLAATAPMGITPEDVHAMVAQGLLAPAAAQAVAGPELTVAHGDLSGSKRSKRSDEASGRSSKERYQAAYPVATELTASLGLRGFRLNLAVEAAGSFADLAALAPKIRQAVGDVPFTRLDQALFG